MGKNGFLVLVLLVMFGCAVPPSGTGESGTKETDDSTFNGQRTTALGIEFRLSGKLIEMRRDDRALWHYVSIYAPPVTLRIHRDIGDRPIRICAASEVYALAKVFKRPIGRPCMAKERYLEKVTHDEAIDGNILRFAGDDRHNRYLREDRKIVNGIDTLTIERITARMGRASHTGVMYMVIWVDMNDDSIVQRSEADLVAMKVYEWPENER